MTDLSTRLLVLGTIGLVILGLVLWRRRPAHSRPISRPELGAGIHFFTSSSCSTCARVRDRLDQTIPGRYQEVRFEDDPVGFGGYGVSSVPTLMVVDGAGDGRAWEGMPSMRELKLLRGVK